MTQLIGTNAELWSIFDARRVKAPELKGLDAIANGYVGWFKNRRPVLARLRAQAARIERLGPESHRPAPGPFGGGGAACRDLARLGRLKGDALDRAVAIAREGALRATGLR